MIKIFPLKEKVTFATEPQNCSVLKKKKNMSYIEKFIDTFGLFLKTREFP